MSIPALRRRRRLGVAFLAFVSVLALLTPAALAQEEQPPTPAATVLQVDDAGDGTDIYLRTPESIETLTIDVNGETGLQQSVSRMNQIPSNQDTVLLIDNSEATRIDETFDAVRDAAMAYINGRDLNERIGIVTAGGTAKTRRDFTNNIDAAISSVVSMVPGGQLALWDAIDLASTNLIVSGAPVRNIVVLTANPDVRSSASAAAARGAAVNANASVFVVGLRGSSDLNDASLTRAVELAGGDIAVTADPAELSALMTSVGDAVKNTYLVRVRQDLPVREGANRLTLTVDGTPVTVGFTPGAVTTSGALTPATTPTGNGSFGFLKTDNGRTLSVLLGAMAAALAAYAFALLFENEQTGLNAVLQPYSGEGAPAGAEEGSALSRNAVFAKAFDFTENLAQRRGVLQRTEAALERADMPLRAAEALTFYAGAILIIAVLSYLKFSSLIVSIVFVGLAALVGPALVNFQANRRKKKFLSQLPDTLQLLAGTLKAGYSFMQGLEAVSQESEDPMGEELRRVVTEAQLGRPVEDALDSAAERMDSPDFAWAVMAVKIQREVGGNLAELLMTVGETMIARERLRRDVASLTAEGRISAIVLGALPILLGLAMWAINPEYVGLLFSEKIGNIMLITSVISALAGFAWMKKLITIEI